MQNTAVFVPLQVVLMVLVSLLTAVVLNRDIRARGFFRGVFFFPVMLSPVVVALVWKWILQREGILNAAFNGMGLQSVEWPVRPDSAFSWAIAVTIWANMGFYTLIVLAGLQSIPRDVYEAAKMDAASPWRQFVRITLPLLRPTTGGGPGSATTLIIQYIYERGFAAQPRNFRPRRRSLPGGRPAAAGSCRCAYRERATMADLSSAKPGMGAFLTARCGRKHLHWTDWLSYLYLFLCVLVMFGPIAWVVISSPKSPTGSPSFRPPCCPTWCSSPSS